MTIEKTLDLAVQNHKKNNFQVAENLYKEVLKINPNHFESIFLLGTLSITIKNFDRAIQLLNQAILIQPNHAQSHNNLGVVFKELGEVQKAMSYYQKAINIQPNYADAHNNLGVVFKALGEFKKAISCYQKAINSKHNYALAYNNMLFTLLYMEKTDSKYYLSKTREFRSSLKPINDDLLLKYQFNIKPKKLRIGFVSGDFREHPVGFFLLDTLNHLKNNDLELIAYSNSQIKDSLSIKLKSHFTIWHEIASQSNMDVINKIRKDGIHILVDLSGHSEKNRLPIFINKPAPVQVSWIGTQVLQAYQKLII